ncbi:MAG: zeta toxin family protein, partial [Vicinamibacteria bacterium]|nr:zeta toxin family protein [Vicinamibacteria bacterium]
MSILVGIAGGTGAGKTSFAQKLLARVGRDNCLLLTQDSYYKDGSRLPPAERAIINYDHPDA